MCEWMSDEPGRQRQAAQIDDLSTLVRQPRPDRDDPVAQQRHVGDVRRAAGAVVDSPAPQHQVGLSGCLCPHDLSCPSRPREEGQAGGPGQEGSAIHGSTHDSPAPPCILLPAFSILLP